MKTFFLRAFTVVAAGLLLFGIALVAPAQAAVAEPSTSPRAESVTHVSQISDACPSGRLCAYVRSNSSPNNGYLRFNFYHCGVVNLSNWYDTGGGNDSNVVDNQSGGSSTVTTLYSGASGTGRVLQTIVPHPNTVWPVLWAKGGWTPVNSMRIC